MDVEPRTRDPRLRTPILIPDKEGPWLKAPSRWRRWRLWAGGAVVVGTGTVAAWSMSNRESGPQPGFSIGRQVTDTLRSDEALGALLSRHAIDSAAVLRALAGAAIDPAPIAAGSPIAMFRESDSTATTEISFQVDDEHRAMLTLKGGVWVAATEVTPWTSDNRIIGGTLDDRMLASVDSAAESRLRPLARRAFAGMMASALAWQIDVARRIVPGDSFRAVVTLRQLADGQQRIGDIQALELIGRRQRFTAYRFGSPTSPAFAYFDERGRPLGRLFLRAPVLSDGRQSSAYKPLRIHPVLGTVRAHRGVDFPAPEGTPVVAAAAGTIEFAGFGADLGNFILVDHGKGVQTRYGHLSQVADGVVTGRKVRQGAILGFVGQTGLATAPHLHFEFRIWGEAIDMRLLDIDPEVPIRSPFRETFDAERLRLRALLDRCPATGGPCQ